MKCFLGHFFYLNLSVCTLLPPNLSELLVMAFVYVLRHSQLWFLKIFSFFSQKQWRDSNLFHSAFLEVSLLEESIKPRANLPPLLLHPRERRPEKLDYIGVSFGLSLDLFRFWRKHKFVPFYIGQIPVTWLMHMHLFSYIGETMKCFHELIGFCCLLFCYRVLWLVSMHAW